MTDEEMIMGLGIVIVILCTIFCIAISMAFAWGVGVGTITMLAGYYYDEKQLLTNPQADDIVRPSRERSK